MWTCGVRTLVGALAVVMTTAACTVSETEAPALAGPSTLATDLNIQATPDTIMWDGSSQSTVTVDARGPNNQPIRGLSIRVDMLSGGQVADFGTLSARTIVTGDDGRARAVYTAPPRPLDGADGTVLTLLFTPIGSDFRGALTRQVDIQLIPPGVILPPNGAPQPAFTFSPSAPQTFQTILFDASGTKDEGVECGSACSYTWSFGDGGSASGITASHEYRFGRQLQRDPTGDRCEGPERPDAPQNITVTAGTAADGQLRLLAVGASRRSADLLHGRGVSRRHRTPHRVLRVELRQRPDRQRGHRLQAV